MTQDSRSIGGRRVPIVRMGLLSAAVILAICCLPALLAGCGRKEEKKEEKARVTAQEVTGKISQAFKSAKEFTLQEKEAYVKSLEVKLGDYDRKLRELKAQAEKTGVKAQKKLRRKAKRLQKKIKVARARLKDLRVAGAAAWEDVKAGAEEAVSKLDEAY